jgi:hypothetical protein
LIVNDQTKHPAQVWSHDGLYLGGFFDKRAEDGLPQGFYQLHGDDNQGGLMITTKTGQTYWIVPYIGHNRLYEITGWKDWIRKSGDLSPIKSTIPKRQGTGLNARYFANNETLLETIEPPVHYQQFGAERHADKLKPGYHAEWTGVLEPPLTDRYQFSALLGKKETLSITIDGKLVYRAGTTDPVDEPFDLSAARKVPIKIRYHNPDERAELKLFLRSRTLDPAPIDTKLLYP